MTRNELDSEPPDKNNPPARRTGPPRPGRILSRVLFSAAVIIVGAIGGYLIRVYYSEPVAEQAAPGSGSRSLTTLKDQWRKHQLPLDITSFSQLIEQMRDDLETQKLPELKEKLEKLKAQIEERKRAARPEFESEWNKLTERVDELLSALREKRDNLTERFTALQDEAQHLMEREKADGKQDFQSPAETQAQEPDSSP